MGIKHCYIISMSYPYFEEKNGNEKKFARIRYIGIISLNCIWMVLTLNHGIHHKQAFTAESNIMSLY